MAALKHDIAVTMATASLPHHESDMAISNALPAQGRRPTLCNLADGGGTFWRSQIALASRSRDDPLPPSPLALEIHNTPRPKCINHGKEGFTFRKSPRDHVIKHIAGRRATS